MEELVQSTQATPWRQRDYALGENLNILDSYDQMVRNCISLINIPIGNGYIILNGIQVKAQS